MNNWTMTLISHNFSYHGPWEDKGQTKLLVMRTAYPRNYDVFMGSVFLGISILGKS